VEEPRGPAPGIRPPAEPDPVWPRPPVEGWTVDDLTALPGLPPHTELIAVGKP
jgi:hypothetical protein